MLDLGGKTPTGAAQRQELSSIEQNSSLAAVFPALLVVIAAVMTGLVFFLGRAQETQLNRLDQVYQTSSAALESADAVAAIDQATGVANGLKILHASLDQQVLWSQVLKDTQQTTIADVRLQTLTIDERSNLRLEGQASSYQTLASFLATLRGSTFVQRADLVSAALSDTKAGQRVQFALTAQLVTPKVTAAGALTPGGAQ